MQSNDALGIAQDVAEWSRSVIADRAMDSYAHFTMDFGRAYDLCSMHCQIWRNLILDRTKDASEARGALLREGRRLGVSAVAIDLIDRGIAEDLLDCVFDRCQDSAQRAAEQIRALLLAASTLAELKKIA